MFPIQNAPQKQIMNFRVPPEGAVTCPLTFDFTQAVSFVVDLSGLEQQGRLSMVQCVYVDLSDTDSPLTIIVSDTLQTVVCKGRTGGYYPLLVTNPSKITFASAMNAIKTIHLINSPVPGSVWATQ